MKNVLAALFILLVAAAPVAFAVETVTLPADPPATRTAALEEVWRIGGDEDEDVLLGVITGGAMDAEGNVYLMDRQLSQVLVIDPDGTWSATLGREGDGPGEMRRAHSVFVTGEKVGVVQGFPAKIVFLDLEGMPAGDLAIGGEASDGGFRFVNRLTCVGDRIVGVSGRRTFDREAGVATAHNSFQVLDLDGAVLASFADVEEIRDFQNIVFDEAANWSELNMWAATTDGFVCSAPERDAWTMNVRDMDGNLVRVLRREMVIRQRTAEDKAKVGANVMFRINGRRQKPEIKAQDTDSAIRRLTAGPDGLLYVTTCWGDGDRLDTGTAGRFEVVTTDGRFVEELTLTFPEFNPKQDRLIFMGDERFLVIRNFEDAQDAMRAGFGGGDEDDESEELVEAEPLEVVLVKLG